MGIIATVGTTLRRVGGKLESIDRATNRSSAVFEDENSLHINRARLAHLDSLGLDLDGKRIVEVGAGIGLLGGFFEARGCDLLTTEGRADNLAEIARRFPARRTRQVDLDCDHDLTALGHFDHAFCYGTLYHLARPLEALQALAGIADGLLLETCLTPGDHVDVHLVREGPAANQALAGVGCRPTRPWIMQTLRNLWGHAYTTTDQPDHPDFEIDWQIPYKHGNHRAVFIASRTVLVRPKLTETLPPRQARWQG